mmetsp:Transcript_10839/g.31068  ORF Transcript_10839/g.31068 Transcript_10839/m.31068 type:complete len:202 (-) Transcript_10839:1770-2375(-)
MLVEVVLPVIPPFWRRPVILGGTETVLCLPPARRRCSNICCATLDHDLLRAGFHGQAVMAAGTRWVRFCDVGRVASSGRKSLMLRSGSGVKMSNMMKVAYPCRDRLGAGSGSCRYCRRICISNGGNIGRGCGAIAVAVGGAVVGAIAVALSTTNTTMIVSSDEVGKILQNWIGEEAAARRGRGMQSCAVVLLPKISPHPPR